VGDVFTGGALDDGFRARNLGGSVGAQRKRSRNPLSWMTMPMLLEFRRESSHLPLSLDGSGCGKVGVAHL
jgi:hypothetical protein